MKKLFGTDGIRGEANIFPMTAEIAVKVGLAIGSVLPKTCHRPKVLVGKDTRISGYIFESAISAGLCAMGVDVSYLGPMPTPAVAFLTESMRADLGIVISASHNPYYDNGIKFFNAKGFKLDDELESRITKSVLEQSDWNYPSAGELGKASRIIDAGGRYIVHLKHSFPRGMTLEGMKIVLDCANGAGYKLAPLLLQELGATVIPINVSPDGLNINANCGSLHANSLVEEVLKNNADFGIALDGDADRVVLVDEKGTVVDGDTIMAICAKYLMEKEQLKENTLVATIQSNIALEVFMKKHNGTLMRTNVGDRYVVEAMRKHNYSFGGEQSGHIIFSKYSTTGDGILVGLQIARIMLEKNLKLSELSQCLELSPQVMINVQVTKKPPLEEMLNIMKAKKRIEDILHDSGRVLIRYSGTENLCRVMLEGEDIQSITTLAEELSAVVAKELGKQ